MGTDLNFLKPGSREVLHRPGSFYSLLARIRCNSQLVYKTFNFGTGQEHMISGTGVDLIKLFSVNLLIFCALDLFTPQENFVDISKMV
jgi:hypothetical protein